MKGEVEWGVDSNYKYFKNKCRFGVQVKSLELEKEK